MDLTVYRLVRPLSPGECDSGQLPTRQLMLRPQQVSALKALFPEALPTQERYLEIDRLREDHGLVDSWAPVRWDLSGERCWVVFGLADESDRLIEFDGQKYLTLDDRYLQVMEVAELAYMRKPFRKGSTAPRMEGDTLVLSADNFTGCDMDQLVPLLGEEAVRDSYGCYFSEDLARLQQLASHCECPQQWRQKVLDNMAPDCVVVIDW